MYGVEIGRILLRPPPLLSAASTPHGILGKEHRQYLMR